MLGHEDVAPGTRGYDAASVDEIARRAHLPTGSFYQHFRSKRQLLLALMDDLLDGLSRLKFQPAGGGGARSIVRDLLARAFARDLRYLGAYRAWREPALSDLDLARKQKQILRWTTGRVEAVFERLQQLPAPARASISPR